MTKFGQVSMQPYLRASPVNARMNMAVASTGKYVTLNTTDMQLEGCLELSSTIEL